MPSPAQAAAPAPGAALQAYPLLVGTALLWAGNAVAGRWAPGEVSPQVLTCLRWAIVCVALAATARGRVAAEWPVLIRHWPRILLMGGCGFTAFASLFYAAGAYTSAVNLALLQGAVPVFVILINVALGGGGVSLGQALGVAVTLLGAGIAATHGDLAILTHFGFNRGDLLMLAACLLYAGYTVALRSRPKVSGLAFFTALAVAAFLTSLPPLLVEWATGHAVWPTAKGWAIVAFVAIGPSLVSQLSFMRGVELIGPNRAGVFVNLVPVFGAILAVLLVGEPFRWNDALALVLVLGGIVIAEGRFRRRSP
ncbi:MULTISPECIES: DMT family transporter [Methylobacterium]|nr:MULTISPECIES: DMT family transporter [Methylobacterium]PIU04707.1 MAG: EamA family transporter [Methylobacterium sp. CG09_land_8_20_14_0_10_71_15]PIU13212.1 MAG: EamA family transporter [Methylobacterium sp. CG08_land_8_20_14_0_20_71_15]